MINDKLPTQIMGAFDKMLATDKKSSPKSIEEFRSYVDFYGKTSEPRCNACGL